MNGRLRWILAIAGPLIVLGVAGSIGFTISVSDRVARSEERRDSDYVTLMNTRARSLATEAQSARVATEWDQFKDWYRLTESRNQQDHEKILAAIESLKK